uniref:B box-type domain-containing protein n=1 Tax=Podarcis muralis TaxID=64176 RepID=A0A670KBA7_PODMU
AFELLGWQEQGPRSGQPDGAGKEVHRRSRIPNRQLANVVEIAKNLGLQRGKEEGGKGRICEKHQEPLKLFCKVHEAPICLVCDRSKEHENHKVIPLEEASEEYKHLQRPGGKMTFSWQLGIGPVQLYTII